METLSLAVINDVIGDALKKIKVDSDGSGDLFAGTIKWKSSDSDKLDPSEISILLGSKIPARTIRRLSARTKVHITGTLSGIPSGRNTLGTLDCIGAVHVSFLLFVEDKE